MRNNDGYAASFFSIAIDTANPQQNPGAGNAPAYVRSVDGGFMQGSVIAETLGDDLRQVKHIGTVDIQPINIEAGLASSRTLLEWIKQTWDHDASMRSGRIDHGAPEGGAIRGRFAQEFYDALLTEVTFPALSGDASSESAYLKCTIQPGRLELLSGDDLPIQSDTSGRQLDWVKARCRFEVGSREINIAKVDSFTVKQHVKKLYTGARRLPELVPAALEISNITVYCHQADGQYFLDWYQERIAKGMDEASADRTGALIFRSNDNRDLFDITLSGLGIYSLNVEKSVAGGQDLKMFKIGLYVEKVELDIAGSGNFD